MTSCVERQAIICRGGFVPILFAWRFKKTPAAPYYAVIFTSLRTEGENGYGKMAEAMEKLAAAQPGFLERFQNSRALFRVVKGGIFLRKMPLGSSGSGVHQFWNRCRDRVSARGAGNYGVVLGESGIDCGVEAEFAAPGGAGAGTRHLV
jgi:hypothetical protein